MKCALAVLVIGLSFLLAGCGSNAAFSVRPLYLQGEKHPAEPRLEGEWTPVTLGITGISSDESEHWSVTAQKDGCYQGQHRKKEAEKPEQVEIYRICLVSLDNKWFFDQELESQNVGTNMISAKDLAPDLTAAHMAGRVWPEQDLIRLTRLRSAWLKQNQPEELRLDRDHSTLFTGSTAQLREIMTQHGEDSNAMTSPLYLCRPGTDCSLRVVEDQLSREPDDTEILDGSAIFYAGIENYDKAIALLGRAAELADPKEQATARAHVGIARLLKRDFSGARNEFAIAQRQSPDPEGQANGALWTGISYFLDGKYNEAHAAFAGVKAPPDESRAMLIILDYASLVRMGRGRKADLFLSDQMAQFVGDADQQLLLLRAAGKIKDFSPADFTDEQLLQGDGVLYALVRLGKGDQKAAGDALRRSINGAGKWNPVYVGAKIELERLDASEQKK